MPSLSSGVRFPFTVIKETTCNGVSVLIKIQEVGVSSSLHVVRSGYATGKNQQGVALAGVIFDTRRGHALLFFFWCVFERLACAVTCQRVQIVFLVAGAR